MKEKEEKRREGEIQRRDGWGKEGRGRLALTHAFMVPPTSQYW